MLTFPRLALISVLVFAAAGCGSAGDSVGDTASAETSSCAGGGGVGTFHDQALTIGDEVRHYYLHVPADYACSGPAWPLLVDFHGTGFGSATDTVEESWATPELESVSDAEHFIVVRPRSRFRAADGGNVFQWDINPGDLPKNRAFAESLVALLQQRYHVDPKRLYASGFSNGPTMAAHFLGDEAPIFHGYALIAGGLNEPLTPAPSFAFERATAPRVYETTGFRDYMQIAQVQAEQFLTAHRFPKENLWRRESDTGHEVYDWHFREAFRWMDRGERPAAGALAAGWSRETFPSDDSLTEITRAPDGSFYATGARGGIFRRADGAWSKRASVSVGVSALTDICFLASGQAFVAAGTRLVTSSGGDGWAVTPPPTEFGSKSFGYNHTTGVGCSGEQVVATGVWSAATSFGLGPWQEATMGQGTFSTTTRRAPSGTWLALGYWNYVGTSHDGVTFEQKKVPTAVQWYNGIATAPNGRFWVVGEKGTILASTDDGETFIQQKAPRSEDLYAASFADDGLRGVAVGAHGAAFVTQDGGATWIDASTGLDGFLGGAAWLDDHTVVVTGEAGTVLTRQL